jgi:NRAMP (natural resistance-associated macrophage protein)-like metal ion transporter
VSGRARASSTSVPKIKGHPPPRRWLGPGLITGASDDDPSGIATYSQVGAQFGYGLGWTMLLSFPLMAAIQEISARIGRVTGRGLAGNLCRHYPPWLLRVAVALLLVANVINLGADLGAMGSGLALIIGGPDHLYAVGFGVLCATLQIFMDYQRYVMVLKWLSLALFAYVAVVFAVDVPWGEVAHQTLWPDLLKDGGRWTAVVAVFGTTISPYLFFWQSSQEAEDVRGDKNAKPLHGMSKIKVWAEFRRIRIDTYVGMAISNIIGFFIIVAAGATLHVNGITDIQTSAQAAEALRPIAGPLTAVIFALGIIGTGLLAVPVLAGSAAYALGEALKWPSGLGYLPHEAKAFYGTIAVATGIGVALNFTAIDPIKALFWSAVINGVVAVPIMAVMMHMASRSKVMGRLTLPRPLWLVGWLATLVMAAMVVVMVWSSI